MKISFNREIKKPLQIKNEYSKVAQNETGMQKNLGRYKNLFKKTGMQKLGRYKKIY
jgi:hypothetical protein